MRPWRPDVLTTVVPNVYWGFSWAARPTARKVTYRSFALQAKVAPIVLANFFYRCCVLHVKSAPRPQKTIGLARWRIGLFHAIGVDGSMNLINAVEQ
jgi:hypothetical protein